MKILLKLLKISTSQEHKDDKANNTHKKTVSDGEPCILNSCPTLSDTPNCLKKRFKPLYNILDPHGAPDIHFNEINKIKRLKTKNIRYDNFLGLGQNDMIRKGYTEIATKLDSLNSSNINNKNDIGNIPHINVPGVPKANTLSYKKHSGTLITNIKKILEIRKNQSLKDQKEITNLNKNIMIDFLPNIEQLKKKKIRTFYSKCKYPHNKDSISCLYSYLLKIGVRAMGNLNLLNIFISEIEYNNEVMIYCFLASNTNKILGFLIEKFDKLDITPIFLYNVGLFMERHWLHGFFGGRFPIAWEKGNGTRKYVSLSGFINVYRSLEVHNEMNLPDIFDNKCLRVYEKTKLATATLYNLIKEEYNQNLTQTF